MTIALARDIRMSSSMPTCVAAVLAIQGGIVQSGIFLGKSAAASLTVTDSYTAKSVGSGSLDVWGEQIFSRY